VTATTTLSPLMSDYYACRNYGQDAWAVAAGILQRARNSRRRLDGLRALLRAGRHVRLAEIPGWLYVDGELMGEEHLEAWANTQEGEEQ
jgi:hypothetical protein